MGDLRRYHHRLDRSDHRHYESVARTRRVIVQRKSCLSHGSGLYLGGNYSVVDFEGRGVGSHRLYGGNRIH